MWSFKDIQNRSLSEKELILSYMDSMEMIHFYASENIKIRDWRGIVLLPNGERQYSEKYRSTVNYSRLPRESAITITKSSLMQANTEWREKPEVEGAELYYCITKET